ncbi:MAG: serine hydrolase domain-containing protein [Ilumatobacter sp.]|uniref:serine hydrolase domain-containing protein n=1 Tax=Ilumatobacter sp. TaxID=1967498 RepID=UPI0026047456|nr:serine hydrolase domain-containing protein [Ilumatobacter sp.]MDJ0771745.1 serine hydrolase domain-containing protein [Ilumatobacter sp.]
MHPKPAAIAASIVIVLSACAGDDAPGAGTAETESTSTESTNTDTTSTETTVAATAAPASPATTEAAPATTAAAPTTAVAERYDFSAVSPIVQAFVDAEGLDGAGLIVVDREDGVIHHEHWGEFTEDRISLVASSSKMITAGVLMRLHDDGLLDVDAPIADVVDWGAGNPEITPAQLVSNSSGLVGLGPDPTYGPYLCQFLTAGTIQECAESIFATPDDDADVIPPDTEFRYGGAQWQVAGALAEVAAGRSWAELIDEIYVQPCGLEALGYNNHFTQVGTSGFDYPTAFDADPSTLIDTANPNMEGGAYVTTGDYGKLLLMHLRGGMCDGGRVLSEESVDRMHADRIADAYDGSAGAATGYGMGWWIDRETGVISDGGAYGSVPWLDLDDGYGAFLVIEADSGLGGQLAEQLADVVHAAATQST